MSEQHPNGEEIARMLREQGQVNAPPDLADEVMRQVRAEPPQRKQPARRFRLPGIRSVLVPALGLAAAVALVIGIAHLGNLSSSSSSAGAGASTGGGGANLESRPSKAPTTAHRAVEPLDTKGAFAIPAGRAGTLSSLGVMRPPVSSFSGNATPSTTTQGVVMPYTLTVTSGQYRAALARLRALSAVHRRHRDEPSVVVTLRRKP